MGLVSSKLNILQVESCAVQESKYSCHTTLCITSVWRVFKLLSISNCSYLPLRGSEVEGSPQIIKVERWYTNINVGVLVFSRIFRSTVVYDQPYLVYQFCGNRLTCTEQNYPDFTSITSQQSTSDNVVLHYSYQRRDLIYVKSPNLTAMAAKTWMMRGNCT